MRVIQLTVITLLDVDFLVACWEIPKKLTL